MFWRHGCYWGRRLLFDGSITDFLNRKTPATGATIPPAAPPASSARSFPPRHPEHPPPAAAATSTTSIPRPQDRSPPSASTGIGSLNLRAIAALSAMSRGSPGNRKTRPATPRAAGTPADTPRYPLRHRIRPSAVVAVEPAEVNVFPTGNQGLGQVQRLVERMVPPPAALADVRAAIAGDRHIQDRQFAHRIRMRRRDRVGRGPPQSCPTRWNAEIPRTSCTSRQTSPPTVFLS